MSADGKTSAVHLFLKSLEASEDFEGAVIGHVEELLEAERQTLGAGVELYQIGTPYLRQEVRRTIRHDLITLSPLALAMLFLVLFFFFRTAIAALPALTGLMSVVSTLGFMGYMGFGITTVSSMIPLLLLVVGSAEDIHMLAEYGAGLRETSDRDHAVADMASKSRLAILLTSFTTLLGFITMAWNPLPALSEFGIAASFGIGINFLLTILVVPSVLNLVPPPKALSRPEKDRYAGLRRFALGALDRRRRVALIAVAAVVASLLLIPNIDVDTDYLRFFPEDSNIQRLYRDVQENLVGAMPLMLVVDTKRPDGIKDPPCCATWRSSPTSCASAGTR